MRSMVGRKWGPAGLVVALAAAGCSGSDASDGHFEMGTGIDEFEPVENGEEVTLAFGSQGGYHVWISGRVSGLAPKDVELHSESTLVNADDAPTAVWDELGPRDLKPVSGEKSEDGQRLYEFAGFTARMRDLGTCVVDRETRIRVAVTDKRGVSATDERVVIPRPGPESPPLGKCDLKLDGGVSARDGGTSDAGDAGRRGMNLDGGVSARDGDTSDGGVAGPDGGS